MTRNDHSKSRIERALADPSSVFDAPDDVIRASDLDDEDKRRILERWESDARLLQIATEENMGDDDGDGGSLLQRVQDAMTALGTIPRRPPSPTKSG